MAEQQIPSTKEIKQTTQAAKEELQAAKLHTEGLDTTGQRMLDQTQRLVETTEQYISEKNKGEKLQQLIREGQLAIDDLQKKIEQLRLDETINQVDSDRLKQVAQNVVETTRLAASELVTSSSFRQSVRDFGNLLADIVNNSVRGPTEEAREKLPSRMEEVPSGQEVKREAERVKGEISERAGEPAKRLVRGEGEQPENLRQTVEGAVNPVLEKAGMQVKLNKQQMDELWNRFVGIMRQITERENTKKAFHGLFELQCLLREQTGQVTDEGAKKLRHLTDEIKRNTHVKNTFHLMRELFQSIAGGKNLDPLLSEFSAVLEILDKDPEINRYFDELRNFFNHLLEKPELLQDEATIKRGRKLIKRGSRLQDDKIYQHFRNMRREVLDFYEKIEQDPLNIKLRNEMKALVSILALDEEGNFVFKPEVLDQLKKIIVQSLIDRLQIPLEPIYMEGETMDYELSGLVLNLQDILPDRVVIESRGKVALDPHHMEIEGTAFGLRIFMSNINLHLQNANLWFRRKTFPRVEDEGKVTLDVGGRGMDVIITLVTAAKPPNFFRITGVECNMHNLELTLSDTRHDYLYNTLLSLFSGTVARDMETGIENNIRGNLENLNLLLGQQWETTRLGAKPLQEKLMQGIETVQQFGEKTLGTAH